mgnify:CR=1 FL=1
MYPKLWVEEDEEEGKNLFEEELIQTQIDRFRKKYTFCYHKINDTASGNKLVANIGKYLDKQLNVVVFNFVDMLSHARTDSKMIRELAADDAAYRSLTVSWFKHSAIMDFFQRLANSGVKVVITTDHGTIKVNNPNLRYENNFRINRFL